MTLRTVKPLTALLIAVFLTATACGGNETTEPENTENETSETVAPETPDLTLPAEAVFAAQIAQSLLGEPLTDNDQNCLFTAATDNDAFAEAIAAVLDPNASLTPTYFKSLPVCFCFQVYCYRESTRDILRTSCFMWKMGVTCRQP